MFRKVAALFGALLIPTVVAASMWNDPLDPIVVTTDAVATGRLKALRIVHESGHGGWQLYDDTEPLGKPVVVPKSEMLERDPTLKAVTDLPEGWEAERKTPTASWVRRKLGGNGV